MAQQQGLAFPSGGEAQERLANPAEPANTHQPGGEDRPSSGRAFERLRRLSSAQQHQVAAAAGGITSRQAIFPSQVQAETADRCCIHRKLQDHLCVPLCSREHTLLTCLQGPKDGKHAQDSSDSVKIVQLDKELTLEERQLIVKHALATEDQDAEGLLNKMRARMDR